MAEKKEIKSRKQVRETKTEVDSIAYRLKCEKTANGLSHFVMYGDVSKDKTVL